MNFSGWDLNRRILEVCWVKRSQLEDFFHGKRCLPRFFLNANLMWLEHILQGVNYMSIAMIPPWKFNMWNFRDIPKKYPFLEAVYGVFIKIRGPLIPRVPPPFSPMNHPSLNWAKFRAPLLERLRHDWHWRSSIHQGSVGLAGEGDGKAGDPAIWNMSPLQSGRVGKNLSFPLHLVPQMP